MYASLNKLALYVLLVTFGSQALSSVATIHALFFVLYFSKCASGSALILHARGFAMASQRSTFGMSQAVVSDRN